jgi:hypothetical protein
VRNKEVLHIVILIHFSHDQSNRLYAFNFVLGCIIIVDIESLTFIVLVTLWRLTCKS